MAERESKEFRLQLKSLTEAGEFEGLASVYGNTDLGGDRILAGAFIKTLKDNNGRVPLLLDHRIPIGAAILSDGYDGLRTRGILNLDKSIARDVYSDLKFYRDHALPYGMSIGYRTVRAKKEGDVRLLQEIQLFEVTVTITPMNQAARVSDVKSTEDQARNAAIGRAIDSLSKTISEWTRQIDARRAGRG